jgi:transposase InsO family protein
MAAEQTKLSITLKLKIDGDTSNYANWSKQVQAVFKAIGLEFTIAAEPNLNQLNDEQQVQTQKKIDTAYALLITSLEESAADLVADAQTPFAVWELIKNECLVLNAEAASYLDAEFRNTKKDTNTSMKSHLKLMREMADKLHASGETVSNLDFATVIFNSLGPEYREIKRIVLDKPVNQLTYTNIRKALILEELRLKSEEEEKSGKSESLLTTGHKNQHKQHHRQSAHHSNKKPRKQPFCKLHGKGGHWTNQCRALQGAPALNYLDAKEELLMIQENEPHDATNANAIQLIIDSGATSNFISEQQLFINMVPDSTQISLPDGTTTKSVAKGTIGFWYHDKKYQLPAFYLPTLNLNLLSAIQFSTVSEITFTRGKCYIEGKEITTKSGKLFCIRAEPIQQINAVTLVNESTYQDFHRALSHPSHAALRNTLAILRPELRIPSDLGDFYCAACAKGKHTRKHFATVQSESNSPGDLIFTDLLYMPPSHSKLKYCMVIIDDYSSYAVTYYLKQKNEAASKLEEFLNFFKTQLTSHVKRIRCDGGGEFDNKKVKEILTNLGIRVEFTTPHSPSSNGKAERFNRLLLERVRCLLYDSSLSSSAELGKAFWPYAVKFAVNNLNQTARIDKSSNNTYLPYQRFYSSTTNVPLARFSFGDDVNYHILPKQQGYYKLEPRSMQGRFLCYEDFSTTIALILTGGKVIRSRDFTKIIHARKFDTPSISITIPGSRELHQEEEKIFPSGDSLHQRNKSLSVRYATSALAPKISESYPYSQKFSEDNPGFSDRCQKFSDGTSSSSQHVLKPSHNSGSSKISEGTEEFSDVVPTRQKFSERLVRFSDEQPRSFQQTRNNPLRSEDNTRTIPEDEFSGSDSKVSSQPETDLTPATSSSFDPLGFLSTKQRRSQRNNKGVPPLRYSEEFNSVTDDDSVPLTISQALQHTEWKQAVQTEYDGLKKLECWTEVDPDEKIDHSQLVSTKWIFVRKSDGRCKARLCCRGFEQDSEMNYSPAMHMQVHLFLNAIAATKKWRTRMYDVKNAYVNAPLDSKIFIIGPEGTPEHGRLLLLQKALYGLKQSGLLWYNHASSILTREGFTRSEAEDTIFMKRNIIIGLYVDDFEAVGDEHELAELDKKMLQNFQVSISDPTLKEIRFLGTNYLVDKTGIHMSFKTKIQELLTNCGMELSKRTVLPYPSLNTPAKMSDESLQTDSQGDTDYKSKVGSLLYISNLRPDITYAVWNLIAFPNPARLKHLLRYLSGTRDWEIVFPWVQVTSFTLTQFADASFADHTDGKSTTGVLIKLNGLPICFRTKKQKIVAASTYESELISQHTGLDETLHFSNILDSLNLSHTITILTDNAALYKSLNNNSAPKTKALRVRFNRTRDLILNHKIQVKWICSQEQQADALTKQVNCSAITQFCENTHLGGVLKHD